MCHKMALTGSISKIDTRSKIWVAEKFENFHTVRKEHKSYVRMFLIWTNTTNDYIVLVTKALNG